MAQAEPAWMNRKACRFRRYLRSKAEESRAARANKEAPKMADSSLK